jgi:enediyne biosynthesis protein E4
MTSLHISFLIYTLMFFSLSSAMEPDSTLIAWYNLDGQGNDQSAYNNHGTMFNLISSQDRFGNQDGALEFNGSTGYISIPSSTSLESPDSTITMSAWIYMYGWSKTGSAFNPVLMKSSEGGNAFQYRLSIGPGSLGVNFNNWNTGIGANYDFDFFTWYMVSVTYDADSLRYYVNGNLIQTSGFKVKMTVDNRPLEIGRDVPGITEHFNGRIDDVRIYNRALTGQEITLLYDNYHQQTQIFIPLDAFPDSGNTSGALASIWGDYNSDTHPDLFLVTGGDSNLLFTQTGGGQFTRDTSSSIILNSVNSRSAAWADYDNDGNQDLVIIRFNQPNILYHNNGNETFTEETDSPISELSRSSTDATWGDYDGDSNLDLIIANRDEANELFHNNGDGTFARIDTGIIVTSNRSSITPTWIDIDDDGDLDLHITNTFANHNFLYINHGDGFFTRNDTSVISTDGKHGSSPSWGDYDNDGDLDLFVSNTNTEPGENNHLFRNDGHGDFTQLTNVPMANDRGVSAGSSWGDIDNDGDIDLVVANGEFIGPRKNFIYLNKGGGEFERLTGEPAVEDLGQTDGISLVDWDEDGALELFITNRDRNSAAYDNTSSGNWLMMNLIGFASNRSAIGTIIRAKANISGQDVWQMRMLSSNAGRRSANGLIQHFGLGDAAIIDTVTLEWPSGLIEIYTNLEANQILTLTEGEATAIKDQNDAQNLPGSYRLYQNYPNPFNPETVISWQLAVSNHVELSVYNLLGEKLATLISGKINPGYHTFKFDGKNLASGIYYYQLVAGDYREVKKMILLR